MKQDSQVPTNGMSYSNSTLECGAGSPRPTENHILDRNSGFIPASGNLVTGIAKLGNLPGRAASCPCYWSSERRAENFAHHSHALTVWGYAHPCTSRSYCWSQMNEVLQSYRNLEKAAKASLPIHSPRWASVSDSLHAGLGWNMLCCLAPPLFYAIAVIYGVPGLIRCPGIT